MVKGKSGQRVKAAPGQWVARGRDRERAASVHSQISGSSSGDPFPPSAEHSSSSEGSAVRSERIELRTKSDVKALLQHAAALSHKNVTAFLLDAGIAAAEQVVAEQRIFRLSEAEWQAFEAILDRPVATKPRLAELLRERSVLE